MRHSLCPLLAALLLAMALEPCSQAAPVELRILAMKDGTAQQFGFYDADALYGYFQANSPVAPASADRIVRLN
jgi:hypothetical protein